MDSFSRRSRSPRDDQGIRDEYRRRSPGAYDRHGGGRRRSRSPVQIDRYQPGREYIPPRQDDYRRRSPPPQTAKKIDRYVPGQEPPPREVPLFNPIPNPLALESQAGFTFFMEWWRKEQEIKEEKERLKAGSRRPPPRLKGEQESREEREKERDKIQAAYDAYKEKYSMQMAKGFVHHHKDEEWFKERYDPVVRDPLRQRLAQFRRGNFTQWSADLDNGIFDAFTLEGIYKNESNGAGGIVEKEEGETTAATEVLGVSDLVPSKGADLRDEAALEPALLIKTIAPQVSHAKLEAFCKEHLGEGDGGFRWLSLSDPNPTKKFHRIGWILLHPNGDQTDAKAVPVPGRGDGRDEDEDVNGAEGADKDVDTETRTNGAAKGFVESALADINGKSIEDEANGNFQCHVGIHVPQASPRKKALWDLFSAPERVERDLQLAERLAFRLEQELGEDINGVNKVEERVEHLRAQGQLQPQQSGSTDAGKAPRAEAEDGEDEEMEEGEEGEADEDVDDEDLLIKKKKLDLLTEYLRRVFNFCFFCVFETDSVHELARKCPSGHLRRPRASLTTSAKSVAKASAYGEEFPLKKQSNQDEKTRENEDGSAGVERAPRFQRNNKNHQQLQRAFNWVKTYEDKIFQILEPESVDLAKLGGRAIDEAVEEELQKYVTQEDEAKFRCKVPECTKLFKGDSFWRKHVEKRHSEWHEKMKKELVELNNYVLDPAHIVPSRNDANSTGHFVPNSQMLSGTPRNFNLQSFNVGQFGPMMGYAPSQGSWAAGTGGGVGAMRTGRSKYGSRTGGPYERQPQDSRNARWRGGGGARPDMSRGVRGGQSHPDALAVGGGSREATTGRSLKSYEDLDAVGGASNGALDY